MREILFRGKRIDNGEWITGGIFQQKADDVKDEVVYIIHQMMLTGHIGLYLKQQDNLQELPTKKETESLREVYSDMNRISQRRKRVQEQLNTEIHTTDNVRVMTVVLSQSGNMSRY